MNYEFPIIDSIVDVLPILTDIDKDRIQTFDRDFRSCLKDSVNEIVRMLCDIEGENVDRKTVATVYLRDSDPTVRAAVFNFYGSNGTNFDDVYRFLSKLILKYTNKNSKYERIRSDNPSIFSNMPTWNYYKVEE